MSDQSDRDGRSARLRYGVPAIAEYLRLKPGQIRHRIACGLIPTFRIGNIVCAREETLDAWLAEQEAAARKPLPGSGERGGGDGR